MNNTLDTFLHYELTNIDDPALLPNLKEINESSETRTKCLEILRRELRNLHGIEPCLEENFFLRFLRVSKFDTSKAFQRMLKYYHQQEKLLNALKNTTISPQKACSLKYAWFSPYRMKDNSCLVFAAAGKIDHSKFSFAEMMCLDLLAVSKAIENPVNQIAGVTILLDYEGFNLRGYMTYTPRWILLFVETFGSVFPARIKAVHFVNIPSLFLTVYNIVYPFLPKKIQKRMFFHPNDSWKSLHAAIPPEILPELYSGYLKFDSCINMLGNIEELEETFRKVFKYGYIKTKTSRQSFRPIS